jgi:hypothetical protein
VVSNSPQNLICLRMQGKGDFAVLTCSSDLKFHFDDASRVAICRLKSSVNPECVPGRVAQACAGQ